MQHLLNYGITETELAKIDLYLKGTIYETG